MLLRQNYFVKCEILKSVLSKIAKQRVTTCPQRLSKYLQSIKLGLCKTSIKSDVTEQ